MPDRSELSSSACVFCGVIAGSVPAHVVTETEDTVAFLDKRPLFKGHILIVPRAHVITLMDADDSLTASLFNEVRRLSTAVKTALDGDGIFVVNNNVVSQSVAHLHVHVVPRKFKDGLRGFMWPRLKYRDDDEAAEVARRITAAL